MSDFIVDLATNSGTLNFPKYDVQTLPADVPVNGALTASEWNSSCQALFDTRYSILSGTIKGFGSRFAGTSSIGAHAGVDLSTLDFIFMSSSGDLSLQKRGDLSYKVLVSTDSGILTLGSAANEGKVQIRDSAGSAKNVIQNNGANALLVSSLASGASVTFTDAVVNVLGSLAATGILTLGGAASEGAVKFIDSVGAAQTVLNGNANDDIYLRAPGTKSGVSGRIWLVDKTGNLTSVFGYEYRADAGGYYMRGSDLNFYQSLYRDGSDRLLLRTPESTTPGYATLAATGILTLGSAASEGALQFIDSFGTPQTVMLVGGSDSLNLLSLNSGSAVVTRGTSLNVLNYAGGAYVHVNASHFAAQIGTNGYYLANTGDYQVMYRSGNDLVLQAPTAGATAATINSSGTVGSVGISVSGGLAGNNGIFLDSKKFLTTDQEESAVMRLYNDTSVKFTGSMLTIEALGAPGVNNAFTTSSLVDIITFVEKSASFREGLNFVSLMRYSSIDSLGNFVEYSSHYSEDFITFEIPKPWVSSSISGTSNVVSAAQGFAGCLNLNVPDNNHVLNFDWNNGNGTGKSHFSSANPTICRMMFVLDFSGGSGSQVTLGMKKPTDSGSFPQGAYLRMHRDGVTTFFEVRSKSSTFEEITSVQAAGASPSATKRLSVAFNPGNPSNIGTVQFHIEDFINAGNDIFVEHTGAFSIGLEPFVFISGACDFYLQKVDISAPKVMTEF